MFETYGCSDRGPRFLKSNGDRDYVKVLHIACNLYVFILSTRMMYFFLFLPFAQKYLRVEPRCRSGPSGPSRFHVNGASFRHFARRLLAATNKVFKPGLNILSEHWWVERLQATMATNRVKFRSREVNENSFYLYIFSLKIFSVYKSKYIFLKLIIKCLHKSAPPSREKRWKRKTFRFFEGSACAYG